MRIPAIAVLAAVAVASVAPSHAQPSRGERDECLLASQNCLDQVDDIHKRIHKLNREIKKGTRTYTPAELRRLKEKLQETNEMLRRLEEADGS